MKYEMPNMAFQAMCGVRFFQKFVGDYHLVPLSLFSFPHTSLNFSLAPQKNRQVDTASLEQTALQVESSVKKWQELKRQYQ